jgi:DNA-binding response OmpR family regulator
MLTAHEPGAYRPCLIVAHTDAAYTSMVCRAFRRQGWDVYEAQRGPELRRLARLLEADLVVLDVALLEETGWLTCAKLTRERPDTRIILVAYGPCERDEDLADFVGAAALVDHKDGLSALFPVAARPPRRAAG